MAKSVRTVHLGEGEGLASTRSAYLRPAVGACILAKRFGVSTKFVEDLSRWAYENAYNVAKTIRWRLYYFGSPESESEARELKALQALEESAIRGQLEIVLAYARSGSMAETARITGRARNTVAAALRKLRE